MGSGFTESNPISGKKSGRVLLSRGDGREHQNPEGLDEHRNGNLELRGHEVDASDGRNPESPAGDLDRQDFLGDEIAGEDLSGRRTGKPSGLQGEENSAEEVCEKRTVEELIHENFE